MNIAKWLFPVIAVWLILMGGMLLIYKSFRGQNVGVCRVAVIGMVVITGFLLLAIYVCTK